MKDKTITYVRSSNQSVEHINTIASNLNLKFARIDSINEIFSRLSDPSFCTDYIAVNANEFYMDQGNKVFDLVHAVSTLIDCTVCRSGAGKPQKRNTKILVLANDQTKPQWINELLYLNEISYIIPDFTDKTIPMDLVIQELDNVLRQGKRISNYIKRFKNKSKKIKKPEPEIQLTPRQAQIFSIVMTRGASNKTIAKILNISESTVKLHLGSIFKKYGVKSRTQGICAESLWPYDISKFNVKPTDEAYTDALKRKIKNYRSLSNVEYLFEALDQDIPVVLGMETFDEFFRVNKNNTVIDVPRYIGDPKGEHAVCAVGYDRPNRLILIKNSFGTNWGDEGYAWITLDYTKFFVYEMWIFDIDDNSESILLG